MVRHVDQESASVWVEVDRAARVTVRAGDHVGERGTFAVHDHHYALVDVTGLPRGTRTAYVVEVDGTQVWPPTDPEVLGGLPDLPAPTLPTLDHDRPLRLAFGSCRTSVSHDAEGNRTHGVDALRAYALRMAGVTHAGDDDPDAGRAVDDVWPNLLLFLGDQVYADETTAEMRAFLESRRDLSEPPWTELADYQEYAELYRIAWTDPANRWLLSTVPTLMVFDDHDVRDDWNTSQSWKEQMEATSWWHDRIVAGLGSYWVHQHLGNLSPAERAEDALWRRVLDHEEALRDGSAAGELDLTDAVDALAERADADPTSYRWSFARDLGSQARLVVVDSRAARVLDPEHRSMLDDAEMSWLDAQLRGDVEHLLVGTSLPFLLAPGLHHVEAFGEALAQGAWGERAGRVGETLRQAVDLEHWAAFQDGFRAVADMVLEVATGRRGRAPRTVTFLSGDVHHSYVSEAVARDHETAERQHSRIVQAVCSPIRNPLPRRMRFATAALSYGLAGPIGHVVARSAKVPVAGLRWGMVRGPWFDNNLASLEVTDDGLRLWWARGAVVDDDHDRPRLTCVAEVPLVDEDGTGDSLRGLRRRFAAGGSLLRRGRREREG
nr:alkaline phosphatase D family protein [Nocardioides perillae]